MLRGVHNAVIVSTALACFAACANAQVLNSNVGKNPLQQSAQQLKGKSPAAFGADGGYVVAPGIVVTPSAYGELGRDDNPDSLVTDDPALYGRAGGSLDLTVIRQDFAINASGSASLLRLDENAFRTDRWEGGLSGDIVYGVAPGFSISAGGLLAQDEIDLIKERTTGVYAEASYQNELITGFMRGRHQAVDYLNSLPPPSNAPDNLKPFFDTAAFNSKRDEISAGLLIGNQVWLAPYTELSAALVDYTNQPDIGVVNRDGEDYSGKGGIRVTLSPFFQADIGWRWNWRELKDPTIDEFDSNYFDGSLTWQPWHFFSLTGSFDRYIGEPSAAFSRLADVKRISLGFRYAFSDLSALKVLAQREQINEIGDGSLYRRRELNAELTHDLSASTQLYAGLLYEYTEEDRSDIDYGRFRFGGGTRVVLGGGGEEKAGERGNASSVLGRRVPSYRLPPAGSLHMSVGYSRIDLPGTLMTTLVGGDFFDEAQEQLEDHDGGISGVRADVHLREIAQHQFENGIWLQFGASGFYATYENSQTSRCSFSRTADCAYVNIVDFDPNEENNTGPFGVWEATTDRRANYWGAEVYARPGHHVPISLKDAASDRKELPFIFGVGFRQLDQETKLFAVDLSVPDPVDYRESLLTSYYGGFIGVERGVGIAYGMSLSFDARAGLYYAHSSYEGRYKAFIPIGGTDFIIEQGARDTADEDLAFIGGLKVELSKQLAWGDVSLFGHGEYLSYVPRVRLNNDDEAGGSPFGIVGTENGTRLDGDDAFSWTAGARVSIPFAPD